MMVEPRIVPVSIYDTVSYLMIVQVYDLLLKGKNIEEQEDHLFISLFQMKIWTVRMSTDPSPDHP